MDLLQDFKEHGIGKEGHWRLTSGNHSDYYFNKDKILLYPKLFLRVCCDLYNVVKHYDIDIVTSPAVAGVPFGSVIAQQMGLPFVYPEKNDGKMVYRKVFQDFIKNRRVLIIEDIVTTGSSIGKTAQAVIDCGGVIHSAVCILNRNKEMPIISNVPYSTSLVNIEVKSYDCNDCELCNYSEVKNPKTED